MESIIVSRNRVLKRFDLWSVVPSREDPGSIDIRSNRGETSNGHLTSAERIQLHSNVVPHVLEMLETALGPCLAREFWVNGVYRLQPVTLDYLPFPEETVNEFYLALTSAAAAA